MEPYSATLGLRCTRIAKKRDQEQNAAPNRSIAPNLHAARDSPPSQFSTLSLLEHPAIQDTSSLAPVNVPPETNPAGRKRQSIFIDGYPVLTRLLAQLDLLSKTRSMSTLNGTCTPNKCSSSAHGRIRDLDRPVVSRTISGIAYAVSSSCSRCRALRL